MRTIVIKAGTNLQMLAAKLGAAAAAAPAAGSGSGTSGGAGGGGTVAVSSAALFSELQKMNPHVDFTKVEPGTVLIVPDQPEFKDAADGALEADSFDALRDHLLSLVDAATTRVHAGFAALDQQRVDVTAVLKAAAVKRTVAADAELKTQVEAAARVFKADQAQAKTADVALKTLRQVATTELDALGKRI